MTPPGCLQFQEIAWLPNTSQDGFYLASVRNTYTYGMAVRRILFVFFLLSITVVAQVWDSSGNGMLSGNYLFRQVAYQTNELGSVPVGVSLIGFLIFDGQGNYSINGSLFDTRLPSLVQYSRFGTYSISSSGYGFLEQPLGPNRAPLHVLISNGIFIGSTPEPVRCIAQGAVIIQGDAAKRGCL